MGQFFYITTFVFKFLEGKKKEKEMQKKRELTM